MPDRIALTAPAKINLALHVTGQRNDGYHLLDTLVTFAGFGDEIEIERAGQDSLTIDGPCSEGLSTTDNLVTAARDRLRAADDRARVPLAMRLTKRLPVASGVGGGSSDAAATLKGIDAMLGLCLGESRLASIGAPLGADVPMCVLGRPLIARGIGQEAEQVSPFPALPIVLVNPGVAVATPAVFARLTEKRNAPMPPLPETRSADAVVGWLAQTRNDLYGPAAEIAPQIDAALEQLAMNGAQLARMSGSGATCFGIFTAIGEAEAAAQSIRQARPGWFVIACMTGGSNG